MGEGRPEPIHLTAKMDGEYVKVVRGDEVIVRETSTRDFMADAIRELKLRGHAHQTHVVIASVSSNVAWSGSIEQHSA
jgi:hypothetical protein